MKFTRVVGGLKTAGVGLLAVAMVSLGCKKKENGAAALAAIQGAQRYVAEGNQSTQRLVDGLTGVLTRAAPALAPTMGQADRARSALRALHDDTTAMGRDMALYPTSFVALVGAGGRVIAADVQEGRDPLTGKDLRAAFGCVAQALGGTASHCAGTLDLAAGGPARAYSVTAVPLEASGDAGAGRGALVGMMNLARVAQSIRRALDNDHRADRVQLAVGFWVNDRVVPSPDDPDVAQAWRVPQTLLSKLPREFASRIGSGAVTFHFTENQGQMQWGGAASPSPSLGPHTALIVYRGTLPL